MKRLTILLLLCVSMVSFAKEKILLQGAMDLETSTLISALKGEKEVDINGYKFYTGTIDGKDVVVSKTEIGMVNATMSTVLAVENFKPTIIINQGTAGGHDPKLHSLDIVLGEKTFNMGALKSNFKKLDEKPEINTWGRILDPTTIPQGDKLEGFEFFNSDKKLLEIANNTKYTKGNVVNGVIATADQWNRELSRIAYLHKTYNTSAEEMETSAVAQVAKVYNIPFLSVRILSNTEVHGEEFNPKSGTYCQEYVINIVKNLK